jgi:pSer/pThr/pTyr-binding forkhead associated (FHA) protein
MYKLVIQDDEGKTTVVPLVRDEITVGRKEGNTIRLTERNVSRRHARIVRANGSIAIEDLDSYNGVRVNGSRIKGRQPLTISDRIQIGDYLIELKADNGEVAVASVADQLTQPLEKPERASSSSSSIPVMQSAGPTAETTKIPSQLIPPGAKVETTGGASAALTPAPALESTPPPVLAEPRAEEGRMARLTVLSSNFAGVEYELTEPAMVLGRTDDNDIVINHRSISRNHAKIVREGSRYTIVDLQSSNGVRVNSEEYDKIELRRGDLVDLGHVRLRFADPADDYVFKPEDVNDVSTGSSKGVWYALLTVLVVLVGVGVFALLSDGTQGGTNDDKTPSNDTAQGPQPDAGAAATPKTDFDGLMTQAEAALEKRDWSTADSKGREALALAGDDQAAKQRAQQVIDRAKTETAQKVHYDGLLEAIAAKNYAKVKEHFAAIDKKSAYHKDAQQAHDNARDAYIEEVLAQAEPLFDARKCPQIRKLQNDANAVWAEAGKQLGETFEACQKAIVPRPTPRPTPPPPPPPPPPDPDPDDPDDPEGGGEKSNRPFDELLAEAQDAAKNGLYGKARRLCSQALEQRKGEPRAVTVCAIAACNLANARLAKRYYGMAGTQDQKNQIYQICRSKGIEVRE